MDEKNNPGKKLEEMEIKDVTGGWDSNGGGYGGCGFVHKNPGVAPQLRSDNKYYAECDSACFKLGALNYPLYCPCHGDDDCCKNRWHVVTENGSPLPRGKHANWYK